MVWSKHVEDIGTLFDFTEGVLVGFRWDAPRNDGILAVLYAWDEPAGLKDTEVVLRLVDCASVSLRLAANIRNAAEYDLATPWQEIESLAVEMLPREPTDSGYRVTVSSNMEPALLVAECREIWVESEMKNRT